MRGNPSKRNPSLTIRVTMNCASVTFFVGRAIPGAGLGQGTGSGYYPLSEGLSAHALREASAAAPRAESVPRLRHGFAKTTVAFWSSDMLLAEQEDTGEIANTIFKVHGNGTRS